MHRSIFSNTFSYRQRVNSTPLENFLTEIFSFCLCKDILFREDVFSKILKINLVNDNFQSKTQADYNILRPDIEVTFEDTIILFECKVKSPKRVDQVGNYAKLLTDQKQSGVKKYLVFLTKYFEREIIDALDVELIHIRWHEINSIINEKHTQITQQLKLFLNENEMDKVQNFLLTDLTALNTISITISKLDSIMEEIEQIFIEKFGHFSREESLENVYDGYSTFRVEGKDYYLAGGFWWDENSAIPYFGIYLRMPKKQFDNSKLLEIMDIELVKNKKWSIDTDDIGYFMQKPITEFMTLDEDNVITMKRFIVDHLATIMELKSKSPELFIPKI